MITLKLTRDEARAIDYHFFNYLDRITFDIFKINNDELEKVAFILKKDLINQVEKIIERKLACNSNKFNLKLSNSQAIMFCRALVELPLNKEEVYLVNLRNKIVDFLYQEILKIVCIYQN